MAATVDRDLALHHADLADRLEVLPGLDMRLVRIEEEAQTDEFHVLQGLRDTSLDGNPRCCYAYQRWGMTGSRGSVNVEGPMEQPRAEAALAKKFRELTGAEMGSLAVGVRSPGKFWLQHASEPDLKARWKYYVDDGVDGKRAGWYPYAPAASDEVEEVYAQHVANAGASAGSHIRWVRSGHFTYKVDLGKMTQENTRTHTPRTIRRSFSFALNDPEEPPVSFVPLAGSTSGRSEGKAERKGKVHKKPAAAQRVRKKAALEKIKAGAPLTVKLARKLGKVGSKAMVAKGHKELTKGGLKKGDVILNRKGKAVCKSRSEGGKRNGIKNVSKWAASFKQAKAELGLYGFVACKRGTAVYKRTRELWMAEL